MVKDANSFDSWTSFLEISLTLTTRWYVDDILPMVVSPFLLQHPRLTFKYDNALQHPIRVATNCL